MRVFYNDFTLSAQLPFSTPFVTDNTKLQTSACLKLLITMRGEIQKRRKSLFSHVWALPTCCCWGDFSWHKFALDNMGKQATGPKMTILSTWQYLSLENEVNEEKCHFLDWSLESNSKSESVPTDSCVRMPNNAAETCLQPATRTFWSLLLISYFVTTVGQFLCNSPV